MFQPALTRMAMGAGVAAVAAILLATVAWAAAGDTIVHRADIALHRHQRLHFAAHLAAGRVLDICPCSRHRAHLEYWKAAAHAPTADERALATTRRPRGPLDAPRDAARLLRYAAWLAVHDPAARTVVLAGTPLVALLLGGLGLVGWAAARLLYRPATASRGFLHGVHPR